MATWTYEGTDGPDVVGYPRASETDHVDAYLKDGDDDFSGFSISYTVWGGAGNDKIQGGGGGGIAYGEDGNDSLQATGYGNVTDTMYGGAGDDNFWGNSNTVTLRSFYGDAGIDTFASYNSGVDQYYGGLGFDYFTAIAAGSTGVEISLISGGLSGAFVAGDSFSGIEGLYGTQYADRLVGDAVGNVLVGGRGADTLEGEGGNDLLIGSDFSNFWANFTGRRGLGGTNLLSITDSGAFNSRATSDDGAVDQLNGGEGDDVLIGGLGADVLTGGAGYDTASYLDRDEAVSVNLATGVATGGSAAGDTFSSIEALIGSPQGDTLTGNGFNNRLRGFEGDDTLNGGGGADMLEGGPGNDKINGGYGLDTATYFTATGPVTVNLSLTVAQNTVSAGFDTLSSISHLNGSDGYGDTLQGGRGDNRINGFGGDDVIRGMAGADALLGWTGSDTLHGGAGRDTLTGGAGADTFAYGLLTDSTPTASDRITDFSAADRFDLSGIDANGSAAGDGVFTRLAGDGAFTAAAQFRLTLHGADTWLELNTDADEAAEAVIILTGDHTGAAAADTWVL